MSENIDLPTTDEQSRDPSVPPVLSGPDTNDVKQLGVAGEDHPLVQETGDEALKTQTESGAGEFLSDFIYEHDSAWVREWLQNEEAACFRASKLLIQLSERYDDGWLTQSLLVDAETGETVAENALDDGDSDPSDFRRIEIPRPIDEVLEASRNLGYDPTIVWDVYLDERKIVTEDNGIGMTPAQFDDAFNTIFQSGSGVDGGSGGMFGIGSESSALVHGKHGAGAEIDTRSRQPGDHPGFRAYSYLGGANALCGEVEENFYGTRFSMPVQDSFSLSKLQSWVEDYTEQLRVPLLYREHDAGTTPVEEEYEASNFVEEYGDPPIVVERPGEFSLVSGPDVIDTGYHADDEDTFMVSMAIDRNTSVRFSTLWDEVIQIQDEQGRIVHGPNRGRYSDGQRLFETNEKNNVIGELHDDDVMLPQPTGSRDSLKKDSEQKQFFEYVQSLAIEEEKKQLRAVVEEMKSGSHPGSALIGDRSSWKIFSKMVSKHGPYKATEKRRKFRNFISGDDHFDVTSDDTLNQMYALFSEIEYCYNGPGRSSSSRNRKSKRLGAFLTDIEDCDNVYMAASTGGNFTDRFKVLRHNNPDAEVIKINGASKYDAWGDAFGFNVVKNVPVKQDDDHSWDVPNDIHQKHTKTTKKKDPDKLKLRTSSDSSSIDQRLTMKEVKRKLEGHGNFHGKDTLMVFTQGDGPNISDHYDMAYYAAIVCVTKSQLSELEDYDDVVTYMEYTEWSSSALIATEDGAMTPEELYDDDRMVVMAHRPSDDREVVKLLGDDFEKLRNFYAEDFRDQIEWAKLLDDYDGGYRSDDKGNVPDDDKHDTLFAVVCDKVLKRARWAFKNIKTDGVGSRIHQASIIIARLTRYSPNHKPSLKDGHLEGSSKRYRLMADTPNWDDDSDVYDLFDDNHRRDTWTGQMLLGFHEKGIDPSELTKEECRDFL
jgi:Histidine kinase-, DNA gyrase B-, and HSP90-like ATPase.